jgi:Tol biopolymer transport system component/tRNA A-37 threonylcarbamoyl transferase component Bud32
MIGKTISHYKITEELGRGGMGVVYRAEDIKLKRTVALKFLPPELTRDPEAKKRFIREAQAASALDHPNICTIYEINETDDGQLFIAMAGYEGETLKEKMVAAQHAAPVPERSAIPLEQSISIIIQIAEGLAKAHEKGIVHRDIKPANIFITNDGLVKILDFGLAKLAGQAQLTKDSSTLGTVAYMSPEQCGGDKVDRRTDIWSLGVVLYEMLTGKLPFKGDYEQAIIYSILNEEPERVSELRSDLSMELERIVHKTIVKDIDNRYQNAEELLSDLEALKKEHHPKKREKKHSFRTSRLLQSILATVFLMAILSIVYLSTRSSDNQGFRIKRTSPLTTAPGLEQDPSWSPEGTRIAYASDENGNMDIWVQQIGAGQRLNLTKDYTGYDGKPAWSPNGEWIAFVSDRDGGGIFMIPALGGIPKRVLLLSFAPSLSYLGAIPTICWSPDGTKLAYATKGTLYTVPASGGTPNSIPLPPTGLVVGYSEPVWSPDGERIACTGFVAVGVSTSQIWTVKSDGTDLFPVTRGKAFNSNPIWSPDGGQLFFLSDRGGSQDVWWIPVNARGKPTEQAQPLTAGVGVGAIALSRDGTTLVYTKAVERSNIWSIPLIPDRILTLDDAFAITSENNYIELLSVSPNGEWIAFDSNRSGNQDIWIMRKDGSELRQLTTNAAHDWIGSWSPDGIQIAFQSLRSGNRDLYVMPVSGGAVTPLTNHPAEDFIPRWSPDGEKIAFASNRSGNMDVWVMPSNGGEAKQLTFHEAQDFLVLWSPDGKQLVFGSKRTGSCELFLIPAAGGDPVQLSHGAWTEISPRFWSADGQTIYAYGQGGPGNEGANLWAISVSDGAAKALMDFRGSLKEAGHWLSSDGERIYFPLWERVGDLWMAELSVEKY